MRQTAGEPSGGQPVSALSRCCTLLLLASFSASSALAAPPATSASAGSTKPSPPPAHEAPAHQDGPAASGTTMPPDHPGMASGDAAADVSEATPALPPGAISATIVSDQGVPLAGTQVRLGILFQKIAEGESRTEKFAQADSTGTVHFTDLANGSDHAYRVTVQAGPASYQTAPFNLR